MSTLASLEPLPHTRRGWVALVVVGVLFALSFFLVLRFYNSEGGSTVTGGATVETGQQALLVAVEPAALDANVNEARVHLRFEIVGDEYLADDYRLSQNLRITVTDLSGLTEYKFPAGTALSQRDQVLAMDGDSALYPFDLHAANLVFAADTYVKNSDGSIESTGNVPVGLEGEGGVNGWDSQIDLFSNLDRPEPAMAQLTFTRAFSTQVFALLIIAIAGVLALLALITAALVQADRRPAEAALLSWTAALLFALPALRNYLPNGPPFGASVDMYAYLWFMLAAGAAAVLLIFGWNGQRLAERRRQERQEHLKTQAESGEGVHAS